MKDALGGVLTIQMIVIFMIIVNCFLAFSVNYTKAFRAKNEIRSIIEKHEGLTCNALSQIDEFLSKNNYSIADGFASWCEGANYSVARNSNNTPLFCYKIEKVDITGSSSDNATYKGAYYTIVTFVNIDIPLFNRIFSSVGNVFQVKGETALIYSSGINHSGLDHMYCGG